MFSDPYAVYVIGAYSATALILGVIIWATLSANARTRRELDDQK
ncbi:MAG: heme exporter protein CcmD [Pseudomonadota bacterium]